jgi:hypothetical protein
VRTQTRSVIGLTDSATVATRKQYPVPGRSEPTVCDVLPEAVWADEVPDARSTNTMYRNAAPLVSSQCSVTEVLVKATTAGEAAGAGEPGAAIVLA